MQVVSVRAVSDDMWPSGCSEHSIRRVSPPSGEQPTPLLAPEPVQKILWSTYLFAGRRPRAQSGFLGSGGQAERGGGGGVAVKVFKVSFQDRVRFVEQIIGRGCGGDLQGSPRTVSGFSSAVWSRTTKRPASCSCAAWRGSGGAGEEAHEVHWKPGNYVYEPLELRPRVLASVNEGFGANFLRVLRESGRGPPCRLAVRTWKSGHFFHEPLVSDSLAPLRQSTDVWKNFKIVQVNANSDPEVHDFVELFTRLVAVGFFAHF